MQAGFRTDIERSIPNHEGDHTEDQGILDPGLYQYRSGDDQEKHFSQLSEVQCHRYILYMFVGENHRTIYMIQVERNDSQKRQDHKSPVILILHQGESAEPGYIHHRDAGPFINRRRGMRQPQVQKRSHKTNGGAAIHRQIRIVKSGQMHHMKGDHAEDTRSNPSHRSEHTDTRELFRRRVTHSDRTGQALCRHMTKHRQHDTCHKRDKRDLLGCQEQKDTRQYIQYCQDLLGGKITVGNRTDKRGCHRTDSHRTQHQ